jgi:integrase
MKKEAYADSTIEYTGKRLRHLASHSNLENPEDVKAFIAQKNCTPAYKESLIEAYALYCKAHQIQWNQPFYNRYDKQPRIPTEQRLNQIIADASPRLSLALSIIKDLGLRPIELTWLKLRDTDLDSGAITITSAKHCRGRTLKIKPQTLAMLKAYVLTKNKGQNDLLFPMKSSSLSENYRVVRNRVAEKLQDPAIRTIRLYDFRHWKASTEYAKTKDLLHVKALLGHKDLRTTLRYTQLISFGADEYHVSVAKNVNEATQLIENGFEYVTEMDGVKLFRKRK